MSQSAPAALRLPTEMPDHPQDRKEVEGQLSLPLGLLASAPFVVEGPTELNSWVLFL